MAVMADTRSRPTASVAFAEGVAPSAARPSISGDSRITQSEIGSIPTEHADGDEHVGRPQPVVRISHVTSGTSRLIRSSTRCRATRARCRVAR